MKRMGQLLVNKKKLDKRLKKIAETEGADKTTNNPEVAKVKLQIKDIQ